MDCRQHLQRAGCLALSAVLGCAGCAFVPHNTPDPAAQSNAPAANSAVPPAVASANRAVSASAPPLPQVEFAAILAEVQQLGATDPAAQNALLEDMKRTDPTLWPQLLQTFRASIAYRRQTEERRLAAQQAAGPALAGAPPGPIRQAGYEDGELHPGAVLVQQLPGAADGTVAPLSPAAEFAASYPDTHLPEISLVKSVRAEIPAAPIASPAPADWHDQLQGAIRTLESKMTADSAARSNQASATDQATLRVLYLAAGWCDDAARPLEAVPATDREFWREELTGLATVLDDRKIADASRRAAEAEQHLQNATSTLSQSAPLAVRNPTFCTEVTSFGVIKPFTKYEFRPGQEVLLYAELENFASDPSDKGYHTAMHSSYQIFDSRGAKVAEQDYAVTEEYCRNARRDYFLRYFLYLPKQISSGNYTLLLTIEDTLGKKIGQTSVQFAIASAD
jgi:hypothetical protein